MNKLLITIIFSFISIIPASGKNWSINQAHSEILFQIPYLKWSEVTGRFKKISGTVTHNELTGVPQKVLIEIETASIDTGNAMRDGHLQSHDFLQSKFYPLIVFKSSKITRLSSAKFDILGSLTIKNVTRPQRLIVKSSEIIKDTWGFENRFVKFSTEINRKDFGLNWNKTINAQEFLIGDVVKVVGSIQLQPKLTPHSKHMIPDTAYIRDRERLSRGEIIQTDLKKKMIPQAKPDKKDFSGEVQVKKVEPNEISSKHQTTFWWTCFTILGFFGFVGVTMVGFYLKKALVRVYTNQYDETGPIGFLSDLMMISLVFLYSLTYWFLGWGYL
jgi:polyisoprenoid-binding protein YceI